MPLPFHYPPHVAVRKSKTVKKSGVWHFKRAYGFHTRKGFVKADFCRGRSGVEGRMLLQARHSGRGWHTDCALGSVIKFEFLQSFKPGISDLCVFTLGLVFQLITLITNLKIR